VAIENTNPGSLYFALRLLVILLGVAIVGYAGYWLREFLEVDRCLDSGGAFNRDTHTCVRSYGSPSDIGPSASSNAEPLSPSPSPGGVGE